MGHCDPTRRHYPLSWPTDGHLRPQDYQGGQKRDRRRGGGVAKCSRLKCMGSITSDGTDVGRVYDVSVRRTDLSPLSPPIGQCPVASEIMDHYVRAKNSPAEIREGGDLGSHIRGKPGPDASSTAQ